MSDKKSMNLGSLYIAFAALLWTTDVFVRSNFNGILTPIQITFVDHLVIALVISPLIVKYIPNLKKFNRNEWLALLWIGIGGSALATVFLTEGFFLGYEYAGIVVLLQQTQPIIAIGLAHVTLKEKLPQYYYLLTAVAIFGVLLIISPYLMEGGLIGFTTNLGILAGFFGLMASILWGTSTVFGRYLLEHGSEKRNYKQMTTYRFLIATIFLIIFTPIYPRANGYPSMKVLSSGKVILSILYLALIVGLLSLVLYYYGLKTTHASVSAIFELAFPLSYYLFLPFIVPLIDPNAWAPSPLPIQYVGGIILMIASTFLSYIYGKVNVVQNTNNNLSTS